jgi:hypothetical protein
LNRSARRRDAVGASLALHYNCCMYSFDSPRAKVVRAIERLVELQAATNAYLALPPFTAEYRFDPESTDEHVVAVGTLTPPPNALVLLTGEIVQALRTSLDYSVATVIERATGAPPHSDSHFEFPIFKDRQSYEKAKSKKLEGMAPLDVRLVDSLQPFTAESPQSHPLWLLHRLNIEDKHRRLHVVTGALWTNSIRYVGPAGAESFGFASSWADDPLRGPLELGMELFGYHSATELPATLDINFQPVLLFESPIEVRRVQVGALLTTLINTTQQVLMALSKAQCLPG